MLYGIVTTDALVLRHQAISNQGADNMLYQNIAFIVNNIIIFWQKIPICLRIKEYCLT